MACLCQKICWSWIFTPVTEPETGGRHHELTYRWRWAVSGSGHWLVVTCRYSLVDVAMYDSVACDSLQMALWLRKIARNVIVYTDRGGQYCFADYQVLLKRHNLHGSMSAKGYCNDNACVESFFLSLKVKCIHGEHFIYREIIWTTDRMWLQSVTTAQLVWRSLSGTIWKPEPRLGLCLYYVGRSIWILWLRIYSFVFILIKIIFTYCLFIVFALWLVFKWD